MPAGALEDLERYEARVIIDVLEGHMRCHFALLLMDEYSTRCCHMIDLNWTEPFFLIGVLLCITQSSMTIVHHALNVKCAS